MNCRYPINHSPWYAEAPVYVDYPYLTDEDLRLDDYPDLSSDFTRPRDSVILGEPTPAPLQTEPLLEDLLERDDHTDLRRRLLVALVTERILQNNTDAVTSGDFDKQRARIIADACVAQADATPVMTSADCGRRDLPMFVAGRGDYPDATDHVKRALEHQPTWFKLRYYNRPAGESVWRSGLSETDDPTTECKGSGLQPDPTATACDEVPFLRTEEGTDKDMEGNQRPQAFVPHLKTISARDNSGSGGAYGRMVSPTTGCAMDLRRDHPLNGGGYFLVVAVPSAQVPTFHLCNGSNP